MKETYKKQASSKDDFMFKLVGFGVIIFLFWVFFMKDGPKPQAQQVPNINQVTAQLSAGKNGEWGTAAKTSDGVSFGVNVTAFLPKPTKGLDYYVYLKGNGNDLKDLLLGKMVLSGDVYSLNYQSDMDYFGYKDLVVTKETEAQSKEGKMTTVVLTGLFAK